MKRLFSFLTAAALVLSLVPVGALATETVLCEHHIQHDANCGYSEAVPENPCTHVHTQECYSSATQCVHAHTEQCYSDGVLPAEGEEKTADACAHVCSAETGCVTTALDCKHQHDETCGYAPATAGTPCTFVCETCSAAANESAQCTCESKCSEGSQNPACPVCAADPGSCTGKEPEPPAPVCNCTTKCAEDAVNGECPVCGAEGADLSACQGKEPEQPQVTTITEWSWVDTMKALGEDGKLYLPSAITEANLAGITDTLPKNIEANGQNIPVSWSYDWDAQTFTAALPAGYALAESAAPLTLETVDMGAGTLENDPVGYIDENNQQQTCGEYTPVDSSLTTWNSGWYVVDSDETIGQRVTVSGDVKLILTDGCQLTVNGGIQVSEGNALTIYAQSTAEGSMGRLDAISSNGAGIGGDYYSSNGGTITINGGAVTANGGSGDAGIGGGVYGNSGNITINGGIVNTTGGDNGAGIGSGAYDTCGTITINGGTVTANGGYGGAGIGGGTDSDGGSITINGGTVTAIGGGSGAGIGGGVYAAGGDIAINGGTVTATSESGAGIGGGLYGNGGSLSGNCGNVIQASSVDADTSGFAGVIQTGTEYRVYGNVVLTEDLTIQPGETLTIPRGASLDCNGKLANDGTMVVESGGKLEGTPTGNGTVKIAPTITTENLTNGEVGTAYRQALTATGDTPITWTVSGNLPDGLALDANTGVISGPPTTAGTYTFTITATNASGGASKEYTLNIKSAAVPVTDVSLNKDTLELYIGQSETLTATVQPSDAANKNVTWSSDKPEVATVEGGKVTAVAVGSATITVTTTDGGKIATCQVTVNAQNLSSAKVTLGTALTYTGKDQTQTVKSVTLGGKTLTEDTDYTVTNNTGKDAGTYTLTITGKGNYTGTLKVSFPIAKAPLTITGVDVQSKTYDGTTAATVTGVSFKGLVNGEALAMGTDYTATADFDNASADTFKSVTGKVTLLSSTLGKNYVLSDASFLTSGDISAAASKLSFKVDRTKPVKGQYITFSVTPQIKGDNRSFLQRVLGINAPKVEFWANGTTKLGEVKVEEGKTSTFAYDTDKGGLKLGKNTITAEFTGDGNLKGCTESVVVYLHDSTTSAPTGDTSNIQTWTAVLVVSAVVLIGLGVGAVIYRKKKK